ncbi:DUF1684 domain-containing protein [Brachybacterium sp. AOP25-B2-12]|uniref:DUF1684 domain-containing protein n=1 Tax=Brachybacterium sp. AOP25-B2-12 TaxID=3457710 RepID=UPI004033466F
MTDTTTRAGATLTARADTPDAPAAPAPREALAVDPAFAEAWELWHRDHELRRTDPLGFLAIVGLYWLGAEPITVPGAPGRWHLGPDGPVVELADGERLTHGEDVLTGSRELGSLLVDGSARLGFVDGPARSGADGESARPAVADGASSSGAGGESARPVTAEASEGSGPGTRPSAGPAEDDAPAFGFCEVAVRGDGVILRPRRSDSVYLAEYTGTPAYPADPRWVLPARFVRHPEPVAVPVGSVIEGLDHEFPSPGTLEVELPSADGPVPWSLTAFARDLEGGLSVLFRDLTSGVTTYAASRSVAVPAPDGEGRTVRDLNRAVNLPCAYIDFATCPLPPAGNRLPVPVEAGEKLPPRRAESSPWEGAAE